MKDSTVKFLLGMLVGIILATIIISQIPFSKIELNLYHTSYDIEEPEDIMPKEYPIMP